MTSQLHTVEDLKVRLKYTADTLDAVIKERNALEAKLAEIRAVARTMDDGIIWADCDTHHAQLIQDALRRLHEVIGE